MRDGSTSLKTMMIWRVIFSRFLETVEKPHLIIKGNKGSLKAATNIGKKKWLVVIYKEISKQDGFIITAYFLSKRPKGEVLWKLGQ